jgi:predicted amidophosphoribosyltransferase
MRGYDHTAALVYHLSRATGALASSILRRTRHFVQKDVSRAERFAQVRGAFVVNEALNPAILYILVDDVVTSGASAAEAARSLWAAGARQIWLLCIARQPLD